MALPAFDPSIFDKFKDRTVIPLEAVQRKVRDACSIGQGPEEGVILGVALNLQSFGKFLVFQLTNLRSKQVVVSVLLKAPKFSLESGEMVAVTNSDIVVSRQVCLLLRLHMRALILLLLAGHWVYASCARGRFDNKAGPVCRFCILLDERLQLAG